MTRSWEAMGLEASPKGIPYPSLDNATRALGQMLSADDMHYDSFLNQLRWRTPAGYVRLEDHHLISLTIALQRDVGIQGNLDPVILLGSPELIGRETKRILEGAAGRPGHIFNLGHGILPNTPVDNVARLVDAVHELSSK
jgi:uroporphyrinogen-III decarboxylase